MKTATAPSRNSEHPPLARDAHGNLLPLPDGTAAWRLCRNTGGRPRVVNGHDRQPLRLPLDMTADDLVDMCGPDTYRLYAIDEVGNLLDYVTTLHTGEPVPTTSTDALGLGAHRGQTSDLRYALEALTQMARTYADSLRAVTEAQADWVKTIAMAKGLPRNVVLSRPALGDDDDDEDDQSVPTAPANGIEAVVGMVAPYVPELMKSWTKSGQLSNGKNPMSHLSRIQAQLSASERQFLAALLDDEDAEAVTAELSRRSVEDAVAMIRSQVDAIHRPTVAPRPTGFMEKVLEVSALLEPAERIRLMKLQPVLMQKPELMAELRSTLEPLSAEEAASWIRSNVETIENRCAS